MFPNQLNQGRLVNHSYIKLSIRAINIILLTLFWLILTGHASPIPVTGAPIPPPVPSHDIKSYGEDNADVSFEVCRTHLL